MIRAFSLSGLLVWSVPVQGAEAVQARLERWQGMSGLSLTAFAVLRQDTVTGSALGIPVELASLGKAITATCVAALMDEGRLAAGDTSRELLGKGPAGITVGHLLTHTSGLTIDATQGLSLLWINSTIPRWGMVGDLVLEGADALGPKAYRYNNVNYAILGVIIEEATGETYEAACRDRVLEPAGVSARLSEVIGGAGPWGGWQMSMQDYATFLRHWYGKQGMIGRDPDRWPSTRIGGTISYGMGMLMQRQQGDLVFWHLGAWCHLGDADVLTIAAIRQGAWAVAAAHEGCADARVVEALEAVLLKDMPR